MKKIILASLCLFIASLSFGQTFTVNVETLTSTDNGLIMSCPQTNVPTLTSGTLIQGIEQANLGKIKKIIFANNVNVIDLSTKWTVTTLCADNVSIIGPTNRNITIKNNSWTAAIVFKGNNDTIANLSFQDAYIELNGIGTYVYNNIFNTSQEIGSVFIFNSKYNTVINNVMKSTNTSTWRQLSAIRIGSNQAGLIQGNSLGDKILYNKASGFTGNGLQAGEWKKTTPICDSLLIRGNEFYNNNNAGIYVISSTGTIIDSNYCYSNNLAGGIVVDDSKFTKVMANKVGLDKSGNKLGNFNNGININGGNNIQVGDLILGGNVVVKSGNGIQRTDTKDGYNCGIIFSFSPITNSLPINSSIKSNYVGVLSDGTGDTINTGNDESGIYFNSSTVTSILNDTIEGNYVGFNGYTDKTSKNANSGIQINRNNKQIKILNNFVGIFSDGSKIPNKWDGICLKGATNCRVSGNYVGNNGHGISIRYWVDWANSIFGESSSDTVSKNIVGTFTGLDNHSNTLNNSSQNTGISVEFGSQNCVIGGSLASDSNLVKNEVIGIWIAGTGTRATSGHKIQNNKIYNCSEEGILVKNNTQNLQITSNKLNKNTIGISFTGAADKPVVQGNTIDSSVTNGIEISAGVVSYKSLNNKIQNTSVGNGVYVNYAITNAEFRTDSLINNNADGYKFNKGTLAIIGGTNTGEENFIKGNKGIGINLAQGVVNNVQMRRNSISCNGVTGIRLSNNANAEFAGISDKIAIDTLASTKDTIVGIVNQDAPKVGVIVELFDKGPECKQFCRDDVFRQGYQFIGTAITDSKGQFKIVLSTPVVDPKSLTFTVTTANATNTTGDFSTSEFSRCTNVLPVNFYKFTANKTLQGIVLNWKTAQEVNNDHFVVEKSIDGIHFFAISSPIEGAGFSNSVLNYSFIDNNPNDEINYYRIKQVDYDGKYAYSNIVAVNMGTGNLLLIYPNPTKGEVTIKVVDESSNAYNIIVYNAIGQEIFNSEMEIYGSYAEKKLSLEHLAKGIYTVHITSEKDTWVKKIIKE